MNKKYCILTNDIEEHSIWYNSLRDETAELVMRKALPTLLNLYAKYNVKTTMFFTGTIAEKYPAIIEELAYYNHEIACHGYSHEIQHGFDIMSYDDQRTHLLKAKDILENSSRKEVVSFRAPALRVNTDTTRALAESGYKIDSSIASQRFDFFLSFGSRLKLNWLISPRSPYRTSEKSLFKKGKGDIVEIPISALVMPYIGTTMRIFPNATNILRSVLNTESNFTQKPIVFLIHPNEIIDETAGPRIIQRRADSMIAYLVKDYLRGKMKTSRLGDEALEQYEEQIRYFKEKNYEFITIREYYEMIKDEI